MPWKETGRVFERTRFIEEYLSGCYSIAELASRYGVSRKTLYKWLARHDEAGLAGLEDRSRAPQECPHRTSAEIEKQIVRFRRRFSSRGPKKIIARLSELHPEVDWPAPSTAGDILQRRGLVERRSRRRAAVHPARGPVKPTSPNDVMTIDFKGQFRMGDRRYCYPLTIVDGFSRYILACDALLSTRYEVTRKALERVFRTYGLPRCILSDNGAPFASTGLGCLSRFSVWWIRLGIDVAAATDETGAIKYRRTYRAFGQMTSTDDADTTTGALGHLSRFAFTGRELSVGTFMQYRSRYYDTRIARFLQQDMYEGHSIRPPSLHRYIYCLNNPAKYVDPSGNIAFLAIPAILGISGLIAVLTLYFALYIAIGREFTENRPWLLTSQKVCLGSVKGFALWGALFGLVAFAAWALGIVLMWSAYIMGYMLEIFPVLAAALWVSATNDRFLPWGVVYAFLASIGFELLFESWAEDLRPFSEALDRGAI